jgi:hypothetical protein
MATYGGIIRRSAILLCKSEVTPGTDPTPTIGSNALVAYEVSLNPLGNNSAYTRKPIVGDAQLGVQQPIPQIRSATLSFKVPAHGAAAAGTAPDYGPALKACGCSETIVASTSVTYRLIATATTCTFWFYAGPSADVGSTNWKIYEMNGCVGNAKYVVGADGEPPMWEFEFQGTYVEPIDAADPGDPTLIEIMAPSSLGVPFSWNSHTPIVKSFELDFGNNVVPRKDLVQTSGIRAFILEDRTPKISMQVEEELAAGNNYWNDYTAKVGASLTTGLIGSTAGNRHTVTASKAALESVSMSDSDGLMTLDLAFQAAFSVAALSTSAVTIAYT